MVMHALKYCIIIHVHQQVHLCIRLKHVKISQNTLPLPHPMVKSQLPVLHLNS